jgi:hypothetical protein
LMLVEDRPGSVDEFQADGLAVAPAHDSRTGMAIVRLAGSGLLSVDLALPGHAGYRCVTAIGGGSSDVPILAVLGCDDAIHETALGARLRAFVRRERALRLAHVAGWPSTLGLPSREFDRLMMVVRRCGRLTTQPDRQYLLTVRTIGFLVATGGARGVRGGYSDAWHATQFAIARGARLEHRAIA